MFRDDYKQKYDAIRPDPAFRARIEERMEQEMNKKKAKFSRSVVLLAAVLILVLTGTAVAVVQGGLLRRETERVPEINENVTDVQAESSENGFSLSIDGVLWEDQSLQISYTLSVPDDGQMYLAGLYAPKLNGEKMGVSMGSVIGGYGVEMQALGGDFPSSIHSIMELAVDSAVQKLDERKMEIQAAFFGTDRRLEGLESLKAYVDMLNAGGDERHQQFASSEKLYYVLGEGAPDIHLLDYMETFAAREVHYDRYLEEHGLSRSQALPHKQEEEAYTLSPEDIAATGLVKLVTSNKVSIHLDDSMLSTKQFNALAETTIDNGEYTVTIRSFRLSHLLASYSGKIHRNDGQPVEDAMAPLLLLRADGSELDEKSTYALGYGPSGLGDGSQSFTGELSGYFRLNDVQELLLVPAKLDAESDETIFDLEHSFRIKPIFDEAKAIAEVNATPKPTADPAELDDISGTFFEDRIGEPN